MHNSKLFTPGKLGKLTIKNRLIMTAAGLEMGGLNGEATDRLLAFYEERAKGGVGAIVSGVTRVTKDEVGAVGMRQNRIENDSFIEQQKKIADRLHQYDCKYIVQLQHPGHATNPMFTNGKIPVSASDVPSLIYHQSVRPLTIEEIKVIISEFGDGAKRCMLAGVDAVEIHAAHYYLFHQFLSPRTNKRQDQYGGSTENRVRLIQEVVADIRSKCGPDYPLIVRVSVEEYLQNEGFHLIEGLKICQLLDQMEIDALDITVSGSASFLSHSIEPISYPQGWRKHIFTSVKKLVTKPVIGTSVIRDPDYAEQLLIENRIDFIGSFRNFLADPNWANKAKNNQTKEINRCISCVRCIEDLRYGKPVGCSINAEAGYEENKFKPGLKNNRKIVIVGGGVAGMEAARVLAMRGFKVTLFEKESELGGQVFLSTSIPHKDKMSWYLDYQTSQLKKYGVTLRLSTLATVELIQNEHPYAVIDATGATPIMPKPFIKEGFVTDPEAILSHKVICKDENIIIVGSGLTGLETALMLAQNGNRITIVEMEDKIAKSAYWVTVKDVTKYLDIYDVVYLTSMKLNSIEDGYITLKDLKNHDEILKLPADKVVLSLGFRAQSSLKSLLQSNFEKVYVIGDSAKSGRIKEAVLDGYQIASQIE